MISTAPKSIRYLQCCEREQPIFTTVLDSVGHLLKSRHPEPRKRQTKKDTSSAWNKYAPLLVMDDRPPTFFDWADYSTVQYNKMNVCPHTGMDKRAIDHRLLHCCRWRSSPICTVPSCHPLVAKPSSPQPAASLHSYKKSQQAHNGERQTPRTMSTAHAWRWSVSYYYSLATSTQVASWPTTKQLSFAQSLLGELLASS